MAEGTSIGGQTKIKSNKTHCKKTSKMGNTHIKSVKVREHTLRLLTLYVSCRIAEEETDGSL